jgi:hypothetical protein
MAERMRQMQDAGSSLSMPRGLNAVEAVGSAAVYIAAFLGTAWFIVRRRDL